MNKVKLNNDVFFKWLLSSDDKDSQYLLDVIIKGVTGISYQSLRVLNPEIVPDYNLSKEIILDVFIEDNIGRKLDIEMQMSSLSQYQIKRFIYYSSRVISNQIKRGEDYSQLHEVYHIIFVNDELDELYEKYSMRSEKNKVLEYNLVHIIFISLPYLNKIRKDLKDMNDLELIIYMFKNNLNDGILNLDKKSSL